MEEIDFDVPERDVPRLLFLLKRRLDRMLARLASRHAALAGLELCLRFDARAPSGDPLEACHCLRPAAPTLEGRVLLDLVRLRLEAEPPVAPVVSARITAEAAEAPHAQLALFERQGRRDLEAANRALARLRAELGEGAVVRAELRSAHLPEACFRWVPVEEVRRPRCIPLEEPRPLVRRCGRPVPLEMQEPGPDGWLAAGLESGAVERLWGPFVVSGGWWVREVSRAYHYAETRRGDLLWIYYDRVRRRWMRQGWID